MAIRSMTREESDKLVVSLRKQVAKLRCEADQALAAITNDVHQMSFEGDIEEVCRVGNILARADEDEVRSMDAFCVVLASALAGFASAAASAFERLIEDVEASVQ